MFYLLYLPMDPVHGLEASCFRVVRPSGLMFVCVCVLAWRHYSRLLVPRPGSGAYCTLDSIFGLGAIYIVFFFISYASPLIFTFSLLISSLNYSFFFGNRPAPFPGQML